MKMFLKGYRTVLVNLLFIAAGLAQEIGAYLQNLPADIGPYMIAAGVANIVLRFITTTPIGQKRSAS